MKIILIVAILLTLYITEPLWRVQSDPTELTGIDKEINAKQEERNALNAQEREKLKKLEAKFGEKPSVAHKSRVPKPLQAYWDETLKPSEYIYEDICSKLSAGKDGWETTCQYKVKNEKGSSQLQFDTFVIRDGKVIK